jgi:hypothetical protein
MLRMIGNSYNILSNGPPATANEIDALIAHFRGVPQEYLDLVTEATELELQHNCGQYIRIWGPASCIEMNEGYGIR